MVQRVRDKVDPLFATDKKKRRLKLVCRYQQYEAGNQIVQRVLAGLPKKGLIWHFQGSGKSLLMVFAAQKLRLQPALRNPAVLIIVDRIDLDAQISATFHPSDIPNLVRGESPRSWNGCCARIRARHTLVLSSIRCFQASARPFGFLVLDPIAGSSRCRLLPDSGLDERNPKVLTPCPLRGIHPFSGRQLATPVPLHHPHKQNHPTAARPVYRTHGIKPAFTCSGVIGVSRDRNR